MLNPGRPGRVLRAKIGVNPNSSSLGTDLQVILFGATAIGLLTALLSTALRLWRNPGPAKPAEGGDEKH